MAFRAIDPFWKPGPASDALERRLRDGFAVEPLPADFAALARAIGAAVWEDNHAADRESAVRQAKALVVATK